MFLANGYIDLGTWNCLTPFIGAGVGVAYNTLDNFVDVGVPTAGSGIGRNSSNFNFAWALHAGVSYAVTQNFSVELAYRYLNYGSVTDTIDCTGGCNPDSYKLQESQLERLDAGRALAVPGRIRAAAIPAAAISALRPAADNWLTHYPRECERRGRPRRFCFWGCPYAPEPHCQHTPNQPGQLTLH